MDLFDALPQNSMRINGSTKRTEQDTFETCLQKESVAALGCQALTCCSPGSNQNHPPFTISRYNQLLSYSELLQNHRKTPVNPHQPGKEVVTHNTQLGSLSFPSPSSFCSQGIERSSQKGI